MKKFKDYLKPKNIFICVIFYLLLCYFVSYLIDVKNIFNLQRYVQAQFPGTSVLWYHIFKEAGITEVLQWTFLTLSIVYVGINIGTLKEKGSKQTINFFRFFSIGLILMQLEDTGNLRHSLKTYFHPLFGNVPRTNATVEIVFYAIIGIAIIISILKYGKYIIHSKDTKVFLSIGFIAYFIASFASATRDINYWYFRAGARIHEGLFDGAFYEMSSYYINFLLMDTLIEESLELIGAAAFFCAIYGFYIYIKKNPELIDVEHPLDKNIRNFIKKFRLIIIAIILLITSVFGYFAINYFNKDYDYNTNDVLHVYEAVDYYDIIGSDIHNEFLEARGNIEYIRDFGLEENEAKKVPVLMYHHILPEKENVFEGNASVMNKENFIEQMDYLYKNGYETITVLELEKWMDGKLNLPEKVVCITFDDGYLSNYIYAYPILKEYGFMANQFLITSKNPIHSEEFDNKVLQYLSWEDITDSVDVFYYSNHSHALHEIYNNSHGLMLELTIDRVREDLNKNMNLTNSRAFAYPYGHFNQEILDLFEAEGINIALTTNEGYTKIDDEVLEIKRFGIFPYTTLEKFESIVNY